MVRGHSAVIVDDNPGFISNAANVLRSLGVSRVLAAGDGETGLEIVTGSTQSEGVDLIVLNPEMPGVDSLELLRGFSQSGFTGSIILASGESSEVVQSAWKIGQCLGLRIHTVPRDPLLIGEHLSTAG